MTPSWETYYPDYSVPALTGLLGSSTRLQMVRTIGIKRLLHTDYATLIAKERGYELMRLAGVFPGQAYFLR